MVVLAVMVSSMVTGQEETIIIRGEVGELIKGYEYTYTGVDTGLESFLEVMYQANSTLEKYGMVYAEPMDIDNEFDTNLNSLTDLYAECMDGGHIYTAYLLEEHEDTYVIAFVMLSIDEFQFAVEFRDK